MNDVKIEDEIFEYETLVSDENSQIINSIEKVNNNIVSFSYVIIFILAIIIGVIIGKVLKLWKN